MSFEKPSKPSLLIHKKGEAIETVSTKKSITSLLTSHDGTEVIYHELKEGSRWGMAPEENFNSLEAIYVISGKLRLHTLKKDTILAPGDFISAQPVSEHLVLTAMEDSSYLYVSSKPVFHYYSNYTKELEKMAVNIEEKDGYTAEHCGRIKQLSMLVGEKMGLNSEKLQKLNFGSFLHDIGKTKVPEHILLKPGKLSADEWEIMKSHTVYGAEILRSTQIPHLLLAAEIVEQHHERYDGSGYPNGLKKEEISLESSIVGLVDSYDAMTTDRVYKKARTKQEAIKELKHQRGLLYHPDVVDTFLSIINDT
ncbi:HD domain-containing phosphohydrolase [Salipaludibacillus aurantiacus]|uniref:HDIG domain-containing protein n=1 Tax=Salipaludibacillus aurantiacus TaxID=1601833 RepID=A0A1H9XAL5_9BACI|nr:HD domain-containing phosphohydrolase [Salipaludibacillus aurantiacus]SES43154.1 HDIG domain-containing protein [Salipaludibacillus aurantiacus]